MEVFLILVLTCTSLAFFLKWRQAVGDGSVPNPVKQGLDPVAAALLRIERKIDVLTMARPTGPAMDAPTSAPSVVSDPVDPGASIARNALIPKSISREPAPETSPVRDAEKLETLEKPETLSGPALSAGPAGNPASEEAVTLVAGEAAARPASAAAEGSGPVPLKPELIRKYEDPPISAWEKEARAILGRIWSWVLVGEEFRPKGVSLEFAMAGTWLMRVGVVVLVSCVVWFLKWSMVHGILGPSGRVGLSFAAGVGLAAWGYRMMGKRYQVLGQGLMGGGIAALYFAAFAAGPLYHLLPTLGCFAMMALITAAGCVLASGTRSQVTAILAMLGGYATPVLLSTGVPNFPGLYAYMFLLGGGLLFLAIFRNWRLLHYLAFVAHWTLVIGSLKDYRSAEHFAVVLPFLVAFFVQQHGVNIGYAFRRAVPISILEAVHQFLHAGLFAGLAWKLISDAAGRPWPALLAIGLAVVFVVQTLAVLKRMPSDRLSLSVSLGLAGFFTAWSVPLLFNGSGLTVAWSLMALAWLWTGLRIRSQLLVIGSQILFLLAGIRLGTVDFQAAFMDRVGDGLRDGSGMAGDGAFGEYLKGFAHRLLNFGVFIGSLFAASRLYRNRADTAGADAASDAPRLRVSPEADLPFATPARQAGLAAFLAGFAFLFVTVHFEALRFLGFHPPLQAPGIILIWTAFAGYLVLRLRGSALPGLARVAGAAVALVCLRMMFFDWAAMGLSPGHVRFGDAGLQLAYRTVSHAALLALIWCLGTGRFGLKMSRTSARAYRVAAAALLFLVVTLETRTVSDAFMPGFRAGALSVVWALFAMALVAAGLKFNDRMARFSGLILFGLVAIKVFLSDLASLDMIWRVLSFLAVGSVLLLGSFAYLRASRPEADAEPVPDPASASSEGKGKA
jgi:uncharacterized membrane protein